MESSKILEDVSKILNQFKTIDENETNDSDKLLTEIKELNKQFDQSYKELLQLQQEISPASSIIKVLPNNSEDLL